MLSGAQASREMQLGSGPTNRPGTRRARTLGTHALVVQALGAREVALTCVAAIRISPLLGVHRLFMTPMRWYASARASSVCKERGVC